MGFIVTKGPMDELDELFGFGNENEDLDALLDTDSMTEEQKKTLLVGAAGKNASFEKQFGELFGKKSSVSGELFKMEMESEEKQ